MEHSQNQSRQTERIRVLNDAFRQAIPLVHGLSVTAGIHGALLDHFDELFEAVRKFDAFTPQNDPHEEHDFGAVKVQGLTVWWKFDYYDREMKYLSPDPSDEKVTRRVLTLMLPHEY